MIELLHMDCMEYMATLPDKAFDLAIVGCEIDADYIAGARKRLADHQSAPRLFDAPKPDQSTQTNLLEIEP